MITENDWAYLAGLIDGEGCIHIVRGYKGRPQCLTLNVGNSNPLMIRWLEEKFGVKAKLLKDYHKERSRKPFWNIFWYTRKAASVLQEVLPFLTAKKAQAEYGLAFMSLMGRGATRVSLDNLYKREALKEAIHILNQGKNSKVIAYTK